MLSSPEASDKNPLSIHRHSVGGKKMARRGENIFKRKDGRWEARVLEYRENGSKAYRSLYGKSYTEVKAKKEYYGAVHQSAVPAAKKLATFAYLAEGWLTTVI